MSIRQAVQLSAEIGGMAGETCEPAIQCIACHRQKYQIRRYGESVIGKEPAARWQSSNIHRAKPADGVAQRGHAGQKINRPDIRPPTVPAKPQPATLPCFHPQQLPLRAIPRGRFVRCGVGGVGSRAHAGVSRPISGSSSASAVALPSV